MRVFVIGMAALAAGCGANTVNAGLTTPTALNDDLGRGVDAGDVSDAGAAVDGAARCDPSVLDAATEDLGVPSGVYVTDLSIAGATHQCAVMSDGTVRCRGRNYYGALGLGPSGVSTAFVRDPVVVPGLRGVVQVVANNNDVTCSRHADGTVRCWGSNAFDALGLGHDGDELCGGSTPCRTRPTLVPGLTDVVDIAGNMFRFCALRADGSVWCWGRPTDTFFGAAPTPRRVDSLSDVVSIEAPWVGLLVRFRDGRNALAGVRLAPDLPRDVTLLPAAAGYHSCYLVGDGSMRCVGGNLSGELGSGEATRTDADAHVDPGLCGVRGGAAGYSQTCVVAADRRVMCWGDLYEPAAPPVRPPEPHVCAAATTIAPFDCTLRPTVVPGVDGVDRVFAGWHSACALRLDRSVVCWGTMSPNRDLSPGVVAW